MGDWLYLIIGIAVVGVLTLAGLLTSGRRRGAARPQGGTDVIVPAPTGTDTATEAPPSRGRRRAEPEVATAPTLEKPEGTASRLVRLRQRLSRSQGGLGQGLLALLSRDRLDEDTWEAIEDTLLTADIGVAPTQALVDRLRTRLRVEGGQTADARAVLREELIELVGPDMDRRLQVTRHRRQPRRRPRRRRQRRRQDDHGRQDRPDPRRRGPVGDPRCGRHLPRRRCRPARHLG